MNLQDTPETHTLLTINNLSSRKKLELIYLSAIDGKKRRDCFDIVQNSKKVDHVLDIMLADNALHLTKTEDRDDLMERPDELFFESASMATDIRAFSNAPYVIQSQVFLKYHATYDCH